MNESVKNSKYGLNRGNLKMIALFCMALDHIAGIPMSAWLDTLSKDSALYTCDMVLITLLRFIGRLAFPIFCFFIVEGLLHTRNVFKYAARLLLLAFISEIPYDLAHAGKLFDLSQQNVFWTLFLGLTAIYCIDGIYTKFKLKKPVRNLWIIIITVLAALVAFVLKTDYNSFGVITIIIIYLVGREEFYLPVAINALAIFVYYFVILNMPELDFGEHAKLASIAIGIYLVFVLTVSTIALVLSKFIKNQNTRKMFAACVILSVLSPDEIFAFPNVFLIKDYNGERGPKIGWLFYAFYPLHFAVLFGICKLFGFY
ncbi:MAG: hypothetical protein J6P37_08080 [Lachnospiraceae bacterium]|nr:hypothetical protein [Lachnospiraceae bacterium]